MTFVRLEDVNVKIPVYDSQSLRLFKLPTFHNAKVGTRSIGHIAGALIMHAIKDLSLQLAEGDRVCLIGQNGAGKTTLLRLLAGIYPPTSGRLQISGSTFAMLGGSVALNNDATGYENIRLAANLYDWPRDGLSDLIADIEEFTELGEYLALPTRVYSAGMQARLAFAIATACSSDILLIDEGIGAGDTQFRQKAQARVTSFVNRARIIVLASHSVELCRSICNKALLLSGGQQIFFGDIDTAFESYDRLRAR